MKISILISTIGIGGEQRVSTILAKELIRKGHIVDLLAFNILENRIEIDPRVNIVSINKDKHKSILKNIYRIHDVRHHIKSAKCDVIIGFAIIPSILCSIAAICTRTRVIISERSDPSIYSIYYKVARYFAYRCADGGVFQTELAMDTFRKYPMNRTVIPNPLDIEKLPGIFTGTRRKRIVNVGRLEPVKNQKLIIRAFAAIHERFPEYRLALYGDGTLRESLQELINALELQDCIAIYPATNNIHDEICSDELFILSSLHEGYPNALIEAMALGLPVISTDCRMGAQRELINAGNGIIVKSGNLNEMANAIFNILSNEYSVASLRQSALSLRAQLNSDRISDMWLCFIESII